MKEYLILALGKNDVKLGDKEIKPVLSGGKEIWEQWGSYESDITLPLIQPVLEEMERIIKYNVDPTKKLTDLAKIFILATQQQTEGFLSPEKDTIWFAHITKKILEARYKIKPSKIDILTLEEFDVNSVNEQVKSLEKALKSAEHIYLKLDGALPVLSILLAGKLILLFQQRVKIIRVTQSAKAAENYLSVKILLQSNKHQSAILLSHQYQYAASMQLYEEHEEEYQIYRFLTAWKNMDYELSEYLFRNYLPKEFHRKIQPLFRIPHSPEDALRELYFNTVMQLEIGEYVDVLGRLYSFRENLLIYGLNRIAGYPLNAKNTSNPPRDAHMDFIQNDPALEVYLKSQKEGENPLRIKERSFRVLRTILRFYAKSQGRAKQLYDLINKLDEALEYRNQTIIGHEFQGCSKAILEEKMKMDADEVAGFLQKLLALVDIQVGENSFSRINLILMNRHETLF